MKDTRVVEVDDLLLFRHRIYWTMDMPESYKYKYPSALN